MIASEFESGSSFGILAASFPYGQPCTLLKLIAVHVENDPDAQLAAALAVSAVAFCAAAFLLILLLASCRLVRSRERSSSCWVQSGGAQQLAGAHIWTVRNRRYNLTAFVEQHPGGASAINLGRARNCTELFESYHSLADEKRVRACLEAHYVEDAPVGAPDYDDAFDWHRTPFFDALKRAVRAEFGREPQPGPSWRTRNHCATAPQWAQVGGFGLATAVALYGFLRADPLALLVLPLCYWWGLSPCMHDAGHLSMSRRPWVNAALAHLGSFHMSPFAWAHQHTIGHHAHTNIAGRDPDLYHFVLEGLPGFRTSLELKALPERRCLSMRSPRWVWFRLGLCLRMPLTTCGPSILWDLMSFADPFAFMGLVPYAPLSPSAITGHFLGRLLVVWIAFIHPLLVCTLTARGWGSGVALGLLFALWPFACHGCVFYVFSQVSHVQSACLHHLTPADSRTGGGGEIGGQSSTHAAVALTVAVLTDIENAPLAQAEPAAVAGARAEADLVTPGGEATVAGEWAVHQVEHSLDYAVGSTLWLHLSLGLNIQVVHHLFPQVAWGHYHRLQPIVRRVCDEFGVRYATSPSLSAALRSHLEHLERINAGAHASVWLRPAEGHAPHLALRKLNQLGT